MNAYEAIAAAEDRTRELNRARKFGECEPIRLVSPEQMPKNNMPRLLKNLSYAYAVNGAFVGGLLGGPLGALIGPMVSVGYLAMCVSIPHTEVK